MTFKEQVESYIGTFTDTNALNVWLNQAVRIILDLTPPDMLQQYAQGTAITSGVTAVGNKKLVSVTSNAGYMVRQAAPGMQGLLGDADSIHFATARTPAFVLEGNLLYLFPTDLAAKMFAVDAPAITHASTSIPNFPTKLEVAVVLYTAIQARIKQLNAVTIALTDVDLTGITAPSATWPSAPTITISVTDPSIPTVSVTVPDVISLLESAYTELVNTEDIELISAKVDTILSRLNGARLQAEVAIANLDAAKTRMGYEELKIRAEIAKLDAYRAEIAAIGEQWQTYRIQIQARIDEFGAKLAKKNTEFSQMARELELLKREYNQALYLAIGVTQPGISTSGEPIDDN
jgi:hypothetical protein